MEALLETYPPDDAAGLSLVAWTTMEPIDEDIVHSACCICCAASIYIEMLYRGRDGYVIHRKGLVDDGERASYSHDVLGDGPHPYSDYMKVIGGDPENDYYKFLKAELEREGRFRARLAKLRAKGEANPWSEFYLVLGELESRMARRKSERNKELSDS